MTHNDHIGSPVLICIFIFKYYFKNVVLNQEELINFFIIENLKSLVSISIEHTII